MADRRPMGSLENAVLHELWARPQGATPSEVLEALGADLAYTTVMTILTRLWNKDLVDRERRGRAFAYMAKVTEADLAAARMHDTLRHVKDRQAALGRFVGTLSRRDEKALRRFLEDPGNR
jgi:predicted transcriptional regulator